MKVLVGIASAWMQSRRYRLVVDQLRMESERLRLVKQRDLARYVSGLADYIEGKR